MKNTQIEAIARDYSELHIDIMASIANGTDADSASTPTTPATFDAMVSPNTRGSTKSRSKRHKFMRKIFGKKADGNTPSRAQDPLSPTSTASMPPTPQNNDNAREEPPSPMSVPPTSPTALSDKN